MTTPDPGMGTPEPEEMPPGDPPPEEESPWPCEPPFPYGAGCGPDGGAPPGWVPPEPGEGGSRHAS